MDNIYHSPRIAPNKQKRYFLENDFVIVDTAAKQESDYTYYKYNSLKYELTFYCANPKIEFHSKKLIGIEAKTMWDDLVKRATDESNRFYYFYIDEEQTIWV